MKIMRRRKSIRASKSIVLDDYKYIDFRDGYEIYRKGNSWAAQDSDHRCDPFAITYEQARGIEPIDGCDSSAQKGLGKKLMSSKQICASINKADVFKLLDESGGYTDYNQKIEDVVDAFGVSREVAEGYVWDWSSQLDPEDDDEYEDDDDDDDDDLYINSTTAINCADEADYEEDIKEIGQEFTSDYDALYGATIDSF